MNTVQWSCLHQQLYVDQPLRADRAVAAGPESQAPGVSVATVALAAAADVQ